MRVQLLTGLEATVEDARAVSLTVLVGMNDKCRHTAGVAHRAAFVADCLGLTSERVRLVAMAAWLHDIGYADAVRDTGFHPLDGAQFLRRAECWPDAVLGLVAHHSGASFAAQVDGLGERFAAWPAPDPQLLDILTFADQTVGPRGQTMTVPQRHAEMLQRQGRESANARAHSRRGPYLLDVEARLTWALREAGQEWPPAVIDLTGADSLDGVTGSQ